MEGNAHEAVLFYILAAHIKFQNTFGKFNYPLSTPALRLVFAESDP